MDLKLLAASRFIYLHYIFAFPSFTGPALDLFLFFYRSALGFHQDVCS